MEALEKWVRIRIRLVGICFILIFVLIALRAFQLQVLNQEEWQKRAERQHQKNIPLMPQRGTIYDSHGEEMALSVEMDSIFVEPAKVVEPERAARELASALSLPVATVRARLKSKKNFLWLKRKASLRESDRVRSLGLAGIGFTKEHRRFYPNSEIGAQVIGFTGLDPEGLEGVELQYDSVMLGQGGYLVMEQDALGRRMGSGDAVVRGERRGSDLYLTLDRNLQYIAEKELAVGVKNAGAKAGTIVVLEPSSGRVLAMASQPDYNPNAFSRYRPEQWRNRALCDTFEPGSTFKIFLAAAALNEGVVGPTEKIYCEKGDYAVGGRVVHDHRGYGYLNLTEILKFSSNIGIAKVGKALERDNLYRYLTDFGFGRRTDIDLPGEVSGVMRKPSQWFEFDLAAISFGQGVSVTPLQLAAATAVIANGGNLMAPYVVERVVDGYGQTVKNQHAKVVHRVLSPEVAARMRAMLIETTEEGGTGTLATVPGYQVAGKTGTAQKVDPVTGGYSVDKRVSSFVGFVPADDPKLVILVVIDEPEGTTYGGVVAAPVFSRVAGQSLSYLKILPDQPARKPSLPPISESAGILSLPPLMKGRDGNRDGGAPKMPEFRGMSYRQVLQTMERAGVNIKLTGTGRVVEQSPAAGEAIRYSSPVWVRLGPPS